MRIRICARGCHGSEIDADDWNDDDDEHDGDPDPFGFKFGKTTSRPVAMCAFDAALQEPDYQP